MAIFFIHGGPVCGRARRGVIFRGANQPLVHELDVGLLLRFIFLLISILVIPFLFLLIKIFIEKKPEKCFCLFGESKEKQNETDR